MSDPRLSRTPVTLRLIDEDGQVIELITRSYTDDQFAEYDQWLRDQFLIRALSSADSLPISQRARLESLALDKSASIHLFDRGPGSKMFSSVAGLAKAIHLMVEGNAIEESKIRRLLTVSSDNRNTCSRHWTKMNLDPPGELEKATQKPPDQEIEQESSKHSHS